MKRKIGIMGGTFDPIHIGHLLLAEAAYVQLELEKVLFMPAGKPPHKVVRAGGASNQHRIEMVRAAIDSNSHFELTMHEMEKEGYSFTYQTLLEFKVLYPDSNFYFIIGADSLYDLPKWRNPESICENCIMLVAVRDQKTREDVERQIAYVQTRYGGEFYILDFPAIEIASHKLRIDVKEGKSIRYYVTDQVLNYIYEQGLYKD